MKLVNLVEVMLAGCSFNAAEDRCADSLPCLACLWKRSPGGGVAGYEWRAFIDRAGWPNGPSAAKRKAALQRNRHWP